MTKGLTDETWVPVSRGLLKHLPKMSGSAVKVYLMLLMNAGVNGRRKGMVTYPMRILAADLGMDVSQLHRAIKNLTPKFVTYKAGKNQFDTTIFTIKKYKNVHDYAVSYKSTPAVDNMKDLVNSESTASQQRTPSQVPKGTPKEVKEVKEVFNKNILEIFEHYNSKIKQLRKLTPKRKQKIKSRLEDFSSKELKKAIDHLATSGWHMGENPDEKKYNDLEWLFANYERTEKFIDMEPKISEGKRKDPEFVRANGLKNWEHWELQKMRNAKSIEGIWSEEKWAKEGSDKAWVELKKLESSLTPH